MFVFSPTRNLSTLGAIFVFLHIIFCKNPLLRTFFYPSSFQTWLAAFSQEDRYQRLAGGSLLEAFGRSLKAAKLQVTGFRDPLGP